MFAHVRQAASRVGRAANRVLVVIGLLLWVAACSPERLVGSDTLPPDVPDPALTKTAGGAMAAYRGALLQFQTAFGGGVGAQSFIDVSAVLTDELQTASVGQPFGSNLPGTSLDSRALPEYQNPALENLADDITYQNVYSSLHRVRGQAEEARGLLQTYGGDSAHTPRGHLDAVEGYSELLLADLFCSGIPLSTIDYNGNYTYQPGSTTAQVYQHALTLFDSAMTLAADSDRIVNLARVGAGRALLALGQYAQAAAAVADVPDGFTYTEQYAAQSVTGAGVPATNFAYIGPNQHWLGTVADGEGGNGLNYRSSGDPRTSATAAGTNNFGVTLYHPDKYAIDGSSPIVLADWIEARLIEAEAALQAGDVTTWLTKLNYLRETAISPALPDTTDPGNADERVDLTFRERGFWLFLTGHRQGDLRRLIRQYGRLQNQVYPVGIYPGGPGFYGSAVNAPIPATERANPKFTGCIDRGA